MAASCCGDVEICSEADQLLEVAKHLKRSGEQQPELIFNHVDQNMFM